MKPWPFGALAPFSFDLVEADPPWRWEAYSAKGLEKSPEAQYPTMSLDDIAALPVGDLLAPGGVLFLWCTWPLVAIGAHERMMRAWGVCPKTGGVWAKRTRNGKLRWGPGYVQRSLCEPYLIGTLEGADVSGGRKLGNFIETIADAALDGLAREHSRKPDEVYRHMEALSPNARRASLFSRQSRQGWATWGDQATKFDGAAA
ncbi:MAG: MT-A70 family methyltransferase [Methylocystis sp.]